MQQQRIEKIEKQMEQVLEDITSHPIFLKSVSLLLNLGATRKTLTRSVLHRILKSFELPNKFDQERTIYLINELQYRIVELERNLQLATSKNQSARKSNVHKRDVGIVDSSALQ